MGATIAALLPPSSRIGRPKRPATTGATARPIARRAGRRDDGDAVVGGERGADVGAAQQHLVEAGGRADVGGGPLRTGRRRRAR